MITQLITCSDDKNMKNMEKDHPTCGEENKKTSCYDKFQMPNCGENKNAKWSKL